MTLEVVGNRPVLPRGVHGAADPHFACAIRSFASMFVGRRSGGGALAVYLDGEPVVDVWIGWSDRAGQVPLPPREDQAGEMQELSPDRLPAALVTSAGSSQGRAAKA